MNLSNLLRIFSDNGCKKVYAKSLSANDNSKNQVYFGGSYEVLNLLPIKEIYSDSDDKGGGKKTRFKTKLDFSWINENGERNSAPDAQLILYPKYPEVRFSGFLKGCKDAPSELMANRIPDRLLFLGVTDSDHILGFVTGPETDLRREFDNQNDVEEFGIFRAISITKGGIELDSRSKLLQELKRINSLGWIDSKRLDGGKRILPCNSSNCGGYTLEAELGITPNGNSEPDYFGWEVKQFSVSDFKRIGNTAVTLMTPEPTHGFYVDRGVEAFIKTYGYNDKLGREARMNFGGVHKFDKVQESTGLRMVLSGYDASKNRIMDTDGFLGLVDKSDNIAASWSFSSLLNHWNKKHANACYVPSKNRKISNGDYTQQYSYGNQIMLGRKTDFSLFLREVALGNIYYDPGIKLEFAIEGVRKQATKRRSQFRTKAASLINLYKENERIDLTTFS
jgi:hypothetical protein